MMYYDLAIAGYDDSRWVVSVSPIKPGETEWWDVWAFSRCEKYIGETPIHGIEFKGPGRRTHFTSCSFNCHVVSAELGDTMQSIAPDSIQLIPIQIDDEPTGKWFILNILDKVDCIDFERSKIDWDDMSDERKIKTIWKLEIDKVKAAGHHIFRLDGFSVHVLVSQEMAEAMNYNDKFDGFVTVSLPWDYWKHDAVSQQKEKDRQRRLEE